MKIILVGTCLGVGGAERVMVDLADAYSSRGHEVKLIALSPPIMLRPSDPGIEVVCLNARGALSVPFILLRLRKKIADFQPDVVHAHLFHAILITRVLRSLGCFSRLITTVHSTRVGGSFRQLAYRLTERMSDLSTGVSQEVVDEFVKKNIRDKPPMQVMHNGISVDIFRRIEGARQEVIEEFGLEQDTMLIVSVGRLEDAKDYPNLLNALTLLRARNIKFLSLVVGEGRLRNDLEEQSCTLGLSNHVIFLGIRRDISRLLSAADLFVLSSAWEGLPVAVGEAMSCECIVVATDCGGVRELVADTGLVVPPKNSEVLAETMHKALSLSAEERGSFGVRARNRVRKYFSLDASVNCWLDMYEQRT